MQIHFPCLAALAAVLSLVLNAAPARAVLIDFENLGANLPIDGNFFYDGRSAYDPGDPDATDFSSQGTTFNNEFTEFFPGCCWQGFAYSQTTDTTTIGPGNQYSAVTGSGVGGSATYAVGFPGGEVGATDITTTGFDQPVEVAGGWFTNTTWAALSMLEGDDFAKMFGGETGADPDYLKLTITGLDGVGGVTGAVEFFLADYRFADDGQDYIVTDWTFVDLSSLGTVAGLDFSIESTDTEFGFINTPAYFAMDDLLVVPEPATGTLLALGLLSVAATRRRPARRSRPRRSRARS